MDFLINHWLDITTTLLGLAYILLEYKASIWMWAKFWASCSTIRKAFMPIAAWSSTIWQ